MKILDNFLVENVLPFALKKVRAQYDLAVSKDDKSSCSGAYERVFHLPCCHTIQTLIHLNKKAPLERFDERWQWNRVLKLFSKLNKPLSPKILAPLKFKSKADLKALNLLLYLYLLHQ